MELNQKPSFLKDVVIVGILFVLIMGIHEKLGKHDYNLFKFAAEYDKQHGVYYNPKTKTTEKIGELNDVDVSETKTEVKSVTNGVVYIHGFGEYSQSDLITVKNSIKSFYGLDCVIGNEFSNPSNFYYVGENVMAYRVLTISNHDQVNRHVYVTSEPLCVSDEQTSLISGHARLNTPTCVVSTHQMRMNGRDIPSALSHTVKHEMAHNFGLEHCNNQSCLMKSHGLDTHELCNSCKSKLNLK